MMSFAVASACARAPDARGSTLASLQSYDGTAQRAAASTATRQDLRTDMAALRICCCLALLPELTRCQGPPYTKVRLQDALKPFFGEKR
jgi:hypothetical protein